MASILFATAIHRRTSPCTPATSRAVCEMRLDNLPLAERPRLIRERVLGRVLGRAVAHEVGHFLVGSRDHRPTG